MSTGSSSALLVVLLAFGATVLVGVGVAATGPGPQQVATEDGEATTMVVELRANGNARWAVSTTFNLSTQNETEAYRELAADFENGETSALGLPAYRQASSLASNATGREMAITNVTRVSAPRSMVVNGTGRLTLKFTWENFGRVETRNLKIGDAFRTEERLWLPGLNAGQTLVIKPPDGYGVVNANVQPDNGTLRWTGPATFNRETLEATFIGTGNGDGNGSGNETTPTRTATPGGNGDQSSDGLLWLGLAVLGVGTIALVGYLVVQQDGLSVPSSSDDPDANAAAEETTETTADTSGSETTQTAAAAASAEAEQTDDEADDAIDEELLSDEERVERLLEENGGRMKQANIVKETGWSNAKVSQLLSAMAEEDRIDKLRIGRENLISFPDEDVTELDE